MMNELSLFTGGGGGVYAAKLLGWRTVGYVEWDRYCQRIIAQRIKDGIFDEAPIFGDIRSFIHRHTGWARSYRGRVDVITAGFPCQPFSVAGRRKGQDDSRNMWPATRRTIGIVRPRYAFLENVPGLIAHEYFGTILGDLATMGYDAEWCVLGADDAGAPHRRKRLWILATMANARSGRCCKQGQGQGQQPGRTEAIGASEAMAYADRRGWDAGSKPTGRKARLEADRLCENGGASLADSDEGRRERTRKGHAGQSDTDPPHGEKPCGCGAWWDEDPADVGYSEMCGRDDEQPSGHRTRKKYKKQAGGPGCTKASDVADPDSDEQHRGSGDVQVGRERSKEEAQGDVPRRNERGAESRVGRVAHGLAHRGDRLRALGNGQVPAVAALAWRTLTGRLDTTGEV